MGLYILITIFLIFFSYFLNRSFLHREKLSSYECGFSAGEASRNKFFIKFFLVGLLFLIFDLETILLFPFSFILNDLSFFGYSFFLFFFFFLSLGLFFELSNGVLN